MKDTIMEMPDYQRPYEKCLREGEQSLSDRELLAVILRCGVQGSSSLTLADKILNLSKQTGYSGLLGLFHISMQELMKIHGIGKVKAIQLRSSKTYGFIAHGITCQCIEKHLNLDKQACHVQLFSIRSHLYVP